MAFDLDRSEFVVHRRTADTAAERTVAVGGHLGWKRQSQTYGTAVARTFKHVSPSDGGLDAGGAAYSVVTPNE